MYVMPMAMRGVGARGAAAAGAVSLALAAAFTGGVASASPSSTTPSTAVKVSDKSISGLPATLVAGWHSFTVTQVSKDAREVSLAKLKPGVTLADVKKLNAEAGAQSASATAALITLFKSVAINGGVDTTKSFRTTKRTYVTELTPGDWLAVNSPSNNGATTVTPFTVVAGSVGNKPRAAGGVTVTDFTFSLTSLKAGAQLINFHNNGNQTHEISLVRIDPGHSQADVLKGLAADTPPSFLHQDGFYGVLSPKQTMFGALTFAAKTDYLFVCFLPDYNKPKNYTPHAEEGMYKFFSTK